MEIALGPMLAIATPNPGLLIASQAASMNQPLAT